MSRLTLRELRKLGFAWPPGPVTPPENEDTTFNLMSEATGCESLYHDTKGDTRYLEQKARFEELAAKVEAKAAAMTIGLPITRRKLETLGLEWPFPYPERGDEPIDLERALGSMDYADLHDYTGGRGSLLASQKEGVRAIIARLEELGITARRGG